MAKSIKIVLVSDNHGFVKPLEYVKKIHSDADYLFHCGDTELPNYLLEGFAVVQGNNDYYSQYPLRKVLEIGEHRFLLTHGHRDMIFGQFHLLAERAKAYDCDVVWFVQTHV